MFLGNGPGQREATQSVETLQKRELLSLGFIADICQLVTKSGLNDPGFNGLMLVPGLESDYLMRRDPCLVWSRCLRAQNLAWAKMREAKTSLFSRASILGGPSQAHILLVSVLSVVMTAIHEMHSDTLTPFLLGLQSFSYLDSYKPLSLYTTPLISLLSNVLCILYLSFATCSVFLQHTVRTTLTI